MNSWHICYLNISLLIHYLTGLANVLYRNFIFLILVVNFLYLLKFFKMSFFKVYLKRMNLLWVRSAVYWIALLDDKVHPEVQNICFLGDWFVCLVYQLLGRCIIISFYEYRFVNLFLYFQNFSLIYFGAMHICLIPMYFPVELNLLSLGRDPLYF